jgi:hypothetical protein
LSLDDARALTLLARRRGKHVTRLYGVTERDRLTLISD